MNYINVTVQNCGGDGVRVSGGAVTGSIRARNNEGSGAVFEDGAYAALSNSEAINNTDAGFRFRDSNFLLQNPRASRNRIGLDIGRGSRGDVTGGEFLKNADTDIRYGYDVLAGVFDTAAQHVLDRTTGSGLRDVEAQWLANEILYTTDAALKARKIERLAKKAAFAGVTSPIIGEAYELAKSLL